MQVWIYIIGIVLNSWNYTNRFVFLFDCGLYKQVKTGGNVMIEMKSEFMVSVKVMPYYYYYYYYLNSRRVHLQVLLGLSWTSSGLVNK